MLTFAEFARCICWNPSEELVISVVDMTVVQDSIDSQAATANARLAKERKVQAWYMKTVSICKLEWTLKLQEYLDFSSIKWPSHSAPVLNCTLIKQACLDKSPLLKGCIQCNAFKSAKLMKLFVWQVSQTVSVMTCPGIQTKHSTRMRIIPKD